MQTDEFQEGLEKLIHHVQDTKDHSALMCAEAVPWRCHRSLIADALLIRGFTVIDIFSEKNFKPHTLTPWAHVKDNKITYPSDDGI